MRIILAVVSFIIQLAAGFLGLLILVLALNGFSERDATPGLVVYVVLCLCVALGSALLSVLVAKKLVGKKGLTDFGAGAISLIAFTMLGLLLIVINLFLAIGIAELMRTSR